MFGVDEALSGAATGHGALVVVLIAFALGLRHASDPDHLVAVSTLVAGTRGRATRAAARLGLAWGLGHGTTLLVFGIPMILLRSYLPPRVEALAESLIGVVIVLLAVRLLLRWRRGAFHVHAHEHDGSAHVHVHTHAHAKTHEHMHPVRTPAQAFGVGLVHGMAGSGGVAVLLVAAVSDRTLAVIALLVLVAGCVLSMTILSGLVGRVLGLAAARRRFTAAIPALASAAGVFGLWYAAVPLLSL
jgi:ABC-type nickel/cobalt efflux system permease component RcnA